MADPQVFFAFGNSVKTLVDLWNCLVCRDLGKRWVESSADSVF